MVDDSRARKARADRLRKQIEALKSPSVVTFEFRDRIPLEQRKALIAHISSWQDVETVAFRSGKRPYRTVDVRLKDATFANAIVLRLQQLPEVKYAYKPTPPTYFP